jgi:glutamate/tyrosine decarboxylase-like PLP-dependent enzyme
MRIPGKGWSRDEVTNALGAMKQNDVAWRSGRAFAYVYDGGEEVEAVAKAAFTSYLTENGLDPTAFPSLLKLENDLIAMAASHLGGDEHVVGSFTSGGTESIVLAVKAARDHARATRGITEPEMIVPVTAHAAFHKAAHYLGVKLVASDVDPTTYRATAESMRPLVGPNTVLLVASASGYAHGVVDSVREIAALAAERGLLCHVDGCIGGFLLPYFRRLGAQVPDFDFGVPGVTSMSMDFHKYALCPKGASVVLYRDEKLRRYQYFACSSWTGYTMVNPTFQSSKSGGPLAAAWAVLHFVGDAGYLEYARGLLASKNAIVEGIRGIDGLEVMGEPEMSLVGFRSDTLPVFPIADAMKTRGWLVQAQLAYGPSRENLHVTIQPSNVRWTETFLVDLADAVREVRESGAPIVDMSALGEGIAAEIEGPDGEAKLEGLLEQMGIGAGGGLPGKMADVNALLNAIPRKAQERILTRVVSRLFSPTKSDA